MPTINPGVTINPGITLTASKLPPPVSAGLQLYLDAGNANSYTGSGSTWSDMVNAIDFTLYGDTTPAYSSNNGGYITFDPSSSQYAQGASLPSALTTWTVEAWIQHNSTNMTSGSPCIVTEVYAGNPINFTLGNTSDSFPNVQTGFFNGGWASTLIGTTLTSGNWYHIVGTWDGTTVTLYLNGNLAASDNTWIGNPAARGGQGIRLMSRWDVSHLWGGNLAIVRIYDNDITAAGVVQNFNAERARFGL